MADPELEIRDYEEGDEQAIIGLFERVFGKTMGATESARHWAWEYARNPEGPCTIKLAWAGEQLIGHYVAIPRKFWFCDRECIASVAIDGMTHPDFGGRGVFSRTGQAAHDAAIERGFAFIYGFPNGNSAHGHEKALHWRMIMPVPVHVKPLDVGSYVAGKLGRPELTPWLSKASKALSRAPTWLGDLDERLRARAGGQLIERLPVDEFERFDQLEQVDDLWERCHRQHRLWVVRDSSFLRWRYDERPESSYLRLAVHDTRGELAGWTVLRFAERDQGLVCFVMDLLVDLELPRALPTLLRAIEEQARSRGCAFVSALAAPGSRYRTAFLKQAYLPLPEQLFPQEIYFGVRVLDESIDGVLVLHPESWQLGWGDVDVL